MQKTWISSGGCPITCDFERFSFLNVPKTKAISSASCTQRSAGAEFAKLIHDVFNEQQDWANATKVNYFNFFVRYVAFCDGEKVDPFSHEGIDCWREHNKHMHQTGKWKDSSCCSNINAALAVLRNLDLHGIDFAQISNDFGYSQTESAQAYSDNDIKKLLKVMMKMFNQLYDQFVCNPNKYFECPRWAEASREYSMQFVWNGETIQVYAPVNKLASLSCYLLSYYSWGNTTQLCSIIRPVFDGETLSEQWAKMPALKRRANKIVSIEIGENDSLTIVKHAVNLFTKILSISKNLNPEPGAALFNGIYDGKLTTLTSNHLSRFNTWLKKNVDLRDDFNQPLIPLIQRLRANGIHRFRIYTKDPLKAAIVAEHEPGVSLRNYSAGNKYENDLQIQATSLTMENAARRRQGVEDAKQATREQMDVQILPYEEFLRSLAPPSRNANGGYCKQPYGDRSEKQNVKARQRKILKLGEKLACADLLWCFQCSDQVIVETVEDLWCILSFRECLEEAVYLHLNRDHFIKNFGPILKNIDKRLLGVNLKIMKLAKEKLACHGRHPIWQDQDQMKVTITRPED